MKTIFTSVAAIAALVAMPVVAIVKDQIKVASAKSFAGATDVVIASFNIAFVTETNDSAQSGRFLGGSSSSRIKAELAGVSPAQMQAATDDAYADFAAKMAAAGYRIVDRSTYLAYPVIANMGRVASGAPGLIQFANHSSAHALYFAPTSFGPAPIVADAIRGGMFGSLSAAGPSMARVNYTQHTHQPVIDVRYVVDFAAAERSGSAFRAGSSVQITAQIAMMEGQSTLTLTNGQGSSGTLTLDQPVVVAGDFGDLRDTTTRGEKRAEVIGNVLGGLMGGRRSSSSKTMTFNAVPERYVAGAVDASRQTNTVMVNRMAAIR